MREYRLYEAELAGELHPLRIGQYIYYSVAELTAKFGQPKNPPLRPAKMERAAKGGEHERYSEYEHLDVPLAA